jgi:hypothetical protein
MIIGICVTALEHRSDACSGAGHSEATKKLPDATRHEVPFAKNRTRLLRLARLSDTPSVGNVTGSLRRVVCGRRFLG